jgi:CubicO group peptidase (beta-lactamase class C family)
MFKLAPAETILVLLAFVFIMPSCRALRYNIPNLTDYEIFPYRTVNPDPESVFHFYRSDNTDYYGKRIKLNNNELLPDAICLDKYIDETKSVALLIIRNDTILFEQYEPAYNESSIFNIFSVTKMFITTLVGAAIKDGLIESVDQKVSDYIPELRNKEGFNEITIKHLLLHTTGIKFSDVKYNPISDNARYYYGRDLRKLLLKAKFYEQPGKEVHYSSVNTQLLGLVLERATGSTLSSYLQNSIWTKAGMQYPAIWSLDNKSENGFEKCFSCLNCTATDMATLGRLYLNNGKYMDNQILTEDFIREATCRDTTEGSCWNFQYNLRFGPKEYGSYFSRGIYGQLIYIYPRKNIIIVHLAEKDLKYNPQLLENNILQIIDQL